MESECTIRGIGIIAAVLLGCGFPLFVFGPVLLEQMPVSSISTPAFIASTVFAVFGVWLFLVSCVVPVAELRKVLEPFEATEGVVLFLPYMLYIGTRAVWRRVFRKSQQ